MALYCGPHACFDCGSRLVSLCKLVRYRGGARRCAKRGVRGAARPRRARVLPALREHALPTPARAAHGPLHRLGRLARVAAARRRLRAVGLRGEGRVDCWCVKSHWPDGEAGARTSPPPPVVARCPVDAIESMWHFLATRSHERTSRRREPASWDAHVRGHARSWAAFHDHGSPRARTLFGSKTLSRLAVARATPPSSASRALGLALGAPIPERRASCPTALARARALRRASARASRAPRRTSAPSSSRRAAKRAPALGYDDRRADDGRAAPPPRSRVSRGDEIALSARRVK